MLVRLFDYFMMNYRDFRRFSCVWTHLGALETPGNTREMGYDSHPSKNSMLIRFFSHFMLNYRILGDFRVFGRTLKL
jgi:hypothetical protein